MNFITIKMFFESSIVHELVYKDAFAIFLAISKKLHQISVMNP